LKRVQRVCYDTLPWLISFSLDDKPHDIPIRRQARYESAFWYLSSRCAGSPDPDADSTQPWNYGFYFVADQMVYRITQSAPAPMVGNNDKQTTARSHNRQRLGNLYTHWLLPTEFQLD